MWIFKALYFASVLFFVDAHPTNLQSNNVRLASKKVPDLKSKNSVSIREFPVKNFPDFAQAEFGDGVGNERTEQYNLAEFLIINPDAEMLPVGYAGVKWPGVDHMEIKLSEPLAQAISELASPQKPEKKIQQETTVEYNSGENAAQNVHGVQGRRKIVGFEGASTNEQTRENKKDEDIESSGKKQAHSDSQNRDKDYKDEVVQEKKSTYEAEDNREKGYNASGYHNVYRKDEYKKDADFYDNDHQGGHFKNHARYNEKHAASEGSLEKAGNVKSGLDQAVGETVERYETSHDNHNAKDYQVG